MAKKTGRFTKDIVFGDLRSKLDAGESIDSFKRMSWTQIETYTAYVCLTYGHQALRPIKHGTVNRYVEMFIKANA